MRTELGLSTGLYLQSQTNPERLALSGAGKQLTYRSLAHLARSIAGALKSAGVNKGSRVGVLASRSIEACAGVVGTSWLGATYIPISLKVPEERLLSILDLSEPSALIVDEAGAKLLSERILNAYPNLILVPDEKTINEIPSSKQIRAISSLQDSNELDAPVTMRAEDLCYIMFTSGTTGVPKGVMISAGSVHHFLSVMQERYEFTPEDRVAEPIELSFDLSVFNMFMTWNAGASLHLVPAAQVMAPVKFIRQNKITVWFSIPSVITMMKRTKSLKPGSLPDLRYSIFCGEPLPLSAVQSWREAAPNSIIDNLYGPTEATVACLQERVTDPPVVTTQRGIISIGDPLAGMEACIVDSNLRVLLPEQPGELALSGPQLASGYFRAPDLTASRFPEISGKRWYLTGDLAYQDTAGKFHHLGRLDNQVKVLGYRVELEEIEAYLRDVSGTDLVAAVAWPVSNGTAEGIVGFVAKKIVPEQIREALRKRLPSYMVPASVRSIEHMPLSPNGKIDQKALIRLLHDEKP